MCDDNAKSYREKAQMIMEAADEALDQRVRATLLGLATSAARIATELEAKEALEEKAGLHQRQLDSCVPPLR